MPSTTRPPARVVEVGERADPDEIRLEATPGHTPGHVPIDVGENLAQLIDRP